MFPTKCWAKMKVPAVFQNSTWIFWENERGGSGGHERSEEGPPPRPDLSELPEGCLANILSLTTPKDACRLSVLCSAFLTAAASDAVWDRFLPSDHAAIVSRSSSPSAAFDSKRDLFFHLSDSPLLLDNATKSFLLERRSGKISYMLAARDLFIESGDSPEHWKWISLPESRFPEVVKLIGVWRFEIRGRIRTCLLSSNTNYAAYVVYKWAERAYGFNYNPLELSIRVTGGEANVHAALLVPDSAHMRSLRMTRLICSLHPGYVPRCEVSVQRADGWSEVEVGKFFNRKDGEGELEVCLSDVASGDFYKSGLVIQGIEIRPKA